MNTGNALGDICIPGCVVWGIDSMRWCIYYADGSIYTGEDGVGVAEAPVVGVQFIAQEDPKHVWVALSGSDYFIWDVRDGIAKWRCCDYAGYQTYMREIGLKKVLVGSWIGDNEYEEISRRVLDDLQVGRKSGFAWWEKR